MKVRVFAGALLLCVMQASLGLAAERLPAGMVRLRVTVAQYVDDVEGLSSQLAAVSGGRLEPYAELGFTGFVIVTSDSRAAMVEGDPRVVRVDRVMDETLASAPIAQPRQAAAAQSVAVLAAAAHPGGVVTNAGSTFALGSYGYDAAGNITGIGTDQFRYDPLGRLKTSTVTGSSQEYTYDRFGNLTTIKTGGTTLSIGVDAATNRLSSSPAYNMYGEYDGAGQMTEYQDRDVFTYDELGMVKEWTDGQKRMVYLYTADDERIATVAIGGGVETASEWTIRDLSGKVLRAYNKTMVGGERWTWREDYIYRDGQLLAAEVNTPEKTLHFHLDHLGTPRLITGNGGATVAKHTYAPFGTELTSPNQDAERMKFTSHERDFLSGVTSSPLDYMHARYYIPGAGRFLSVDPGGFSPASPQSWNRYTYALNNPLKYVDPDGREVWVAPGMQAVVDNGRQRSVSFAAMYDRLASDNRVYWVIRPSTSAKPGTRADSTQSVATRDAQGNVTRVMTFSNIPTRQAPNTQTGLVAHEGAHVAEVLDTNKTLKERHQGGERGTVYQNTAAGPNAFESTNALQFERQVGRELRSGVQVIQPTKSIRDMMTIAPGVRQ